MADGPVRPILVVLSEPSLHLFGRVRKRQEPVGVQTLAAEAAIKRTPPRGPRLLPVCLVDLSTAFGERGFADGAASGELCNTSTDCVLIDESRIELRTVPAHELVMLLVVRVGDAFKEEFKARDAADILGWRAARATKVAGLIHGGIRCGGRLDRDRVP